MIKPRDITEKGFTLVEVLIISPIVMVTVVLLMSYLFNQYGQLTQQGAQIDLQAEVQNVLFSMQDDVMFARSFESGIEPGLVDTYQPSGGWTASSTPPRLILADLALTKNRRDPARAPVYINTYGCSPQATLEQNDELYGNIIYFVSGTTLYKRTISAPGTYSLCGTPYVKQSCPAASSTSSCPPDKRLTDKVNTFSITYYDTGNTVTTTPENAERVQIQIQLKDKAFAEDIYASANITLRKLNQ